MKSRTAISTKLDRSFFSWSTTEVARNLLGKVLVHGQHQDRIVETEAYLPYGDPAAHVFRGPTPRTRVLYGPPGHAYLYLNYGLHWMLNIAAEPDGIPGCVLIRATAHSPGPGFLTKAFSLNRSHYGLDLTDSQLYLLDAPPLAGDSILATPRIGIRQAADRPLRFIIREYAYRKRAARAGLPQS